MSEEKKIKNLDEQIRERRKERLEANSKTTPATVLYSVLFKYHKSRIKTKNSLKKMFRWFPILAIRTINARALGDAFVENMKNDDKAKALVDVMEKSGIGSAKSINFYDGKRMIKLPYKENPPEMVQAPYDAVKLVDELEQKELDKQDI